MKRLWAIARNPSVHTNVAPELLRLDLSAVDQTARVDERVERPHGGGAPAEAEQIHAIARAEVQGEEEVEVADVSREADAEGPGQATPELILRRADAVVVEDELAIVLDDVSIQPIDVAIGRVTALVAGAVGAQDQVLGHASPPAERQDLTQTIVLSARAHSGDCWMSLGQAAL